jgi:hypothetical protein
LKALVPQEVNNRVCDRSGSPRPTLLGVDSDDLALLERYHCPERFTKNSSPEVHLIHDLDGDPAQQLVPPMFIDDLRLERYNDNYLELSTGLKGVLKSLYYFGRSAIPQSIRRHVQRAYFRGWNGISFPRWPLDVTVEELLERRLLFFMRTAGVDVLPFIWFWPNGALSATVMTHDVESVSGRNFCTRLMDINDSFGIPCSFQFVPEERYELPATLLDEVRSRGHEINIQDLNHDGRLFSSRREFEARVKRINQYRRMFGARGFRSAVLYRNLNWFHLLDFEYDMSVPNVGHLEVQRGGCCTVFPFSIGRMLELPVTTTQDYSLFYILRDYSLRLWKDQITRIRNKKGLISFIVHPDYVLQEPESRVYRDLLTYLCELREEGKTWITLPGTVADWWRLRSKLKLVKSGKSWQIVGSGSERARLAYAVREGDGVRYEFAAD